MTRPLKAVLSGPNGTITVTDFTTWSDHCHTVYGNDEFVELIYYVNVLQPGKNITLSFFDAENNQLDILNSGYKVQDDKAIVYSVNRYIEDVPRYYPPEAETNGLNELVNALDNYCKAASNYFKMTDMAVYGINNVTKDNFNEYKPALCGSKMALVLDSGTAIRIFTDAENASYQEDSYHTAELIKNPEGYFEFLNINALELGETYTMYIGDDVLKFSALSYGWLAMQLEPGSEKYNEVNGSALQVLVKALYVYANATSDCL